MMFLVVMVSLLFLRSFFGLDTSFDFAFQFVNFLLFAHFHHVLNFLLNVMVWCIGFAGKNSLFIFEVFLDNILLCF
jgi:hypothetical protein